MQGKRFTFMSMVFLLWAVPAQADVVYTNHGSRIEGKILKQDRRGVTIKTTRGNVLTLPRDEIDRVDRSDPAQVYQARLERLLATSDVEGLLELSTWAKHEGLRDEVKQCLEEVLKLEQDNPTARKRLGYRKVQGQWLRGTELHKALGHVRYEGRWITPDDRDRLQAGFVRDENGGWALPPEENTVAAAAPRERDPQGASPQPRAKQLAPLPSEAADLMRVVKGSGGVQRRAEAMRALAAQGDAASAALREYLLEERVRAKKKLREHFKRNKGRIRARLAREIIERRRVALAFINDPSKYPDANHGAVAQPEVDRLVGLLLKAYQDPLALLREQDDEQVSGLVKEVEQVLAWLNEFCAAALSPQSEVAQLAGEISSDMDMKRFPVSSADAKILQLSREALAHNKSVTTSLTSEERACVDATNDYRMMFGLKALKVVEPLVRAARGHSQEMNRLGFFDHNSPTPANRTPSQRCSREGASYTGENIAMGMTTGVQAFNAWYTSSGHHRNILDRHNSIGIGQDGRYWTQDFGADNP